VVVGLGVGWRIHMEAVLAAHKEQERLNTALARGHDFDLERMRREILRLQAEVDTKRASP